MNVEVVPPAARLAAKRGFVRTTTQALAATLTTGISASVVLGVVTGEVEIVPILVTVAVALGSPFISGLASYLSFLSNGIPGEYVDAAIHAPITGGEVGLPDE